MLAGFPGAARAEVGLGFKGGILIPDQDPFQDEFDSDLVLGGVLELDSNIGFVLEADVEYFSQESDAAAGGDITIFPILVAGKYHFLPRYRTTPFVGLGIGAYFFDRQFDDGSSITKTRFGARVMGGVRFFEDRQVNLVIEVARNFVDFENMDTSSFQITGSLIMDFTPALISAR